jgi:hypothetical protein
VREGYVSRDVAHNVYRVVVTETGDLDRTSTERLRRQVAAPERFREEEAFEVIAG